MNHCLYQRCFPVVKISVGWSRRARLVWDCAELWSTRFPVFICNFERGKMVIIQAANLFLVLSLCQGYKVFR